MILGISAAVICLLGLCYLCDARERRDRMERERAALINLRFSAGPQVPVNGPL